MCHLDQLACPLCPPSYQGGVRQAGEQEVSCWGVAPNQGLASLEKLGIVCLAAGDRCLVALTSGAGVYSLSEGEGGFLAIDTSGMLERGGVPASLSSCPDGRYFFCLTEGGEVWVWG